MEIERGPSDRGVEAGPWVAFALAAAFLAWTCLPGLHWHDTGEFPAVTWWLSLSHPPSHAVHAMAARPPQWLPLGDLGFRGNLSSALWLAVAVALLVKLLAEVAPRLPAPVRVLAGLSPVIWPALWVQGARAEVYAVQLVLLAGVALAAARAVRTRDGRPFAAAGFLLGLSGACHSLMGLALVPLAAGSALRARLPLRAWLVAAAAGLAGLGAALYLPLRAGAGLDVGWGNPADWSRFVDTLLARDWQRNFVSEGSTGLDLGENAAAITLYFGEQVGLVGASLLTALLCAGLVHGRRALVGASAAAALVIVPVVATRFFYPFDAVNPDLGGYFAPAMVALLVWTAAAAQHVPARLAWLLAVAPWLAAGFDPAARQDSRTAERSIRAAVDEVGPGGLLVLADYTSWFQSWWLRALLAERPDVLTVFRGRIAAPWAAERLVRSSPFAPPDALAARLAGFPETFATGDAWFEAGVERARLGPIAARLRPAGVLFRPVGEGEGGASVEAAWRRLEAAAPPDLDARLTWAFRHAMSAELLLAAPHPTGALVAFHLDRAAALLPGGNDSLLEELRAVARRRGVPVSAPPAAPQGL